MEKCKNPQPDAMYSKDDFDKIHFYCKNCGKEVILCRKEEENGFEWVHGQIGYVPIIEE